MKTEQSYRDLAAKLSHFASVAHDPLPLELDSSRLETTANTPTAQ